MLWEDRKPEVPAFVEVAADNTSSVLEPFQKAKSASEFLQDEEVVCPLSAACCDVMPSNVVTDDLRRDAHYGAAQARAIMERVFLSFKEKVKALGPKDKSRATVRKNNIHDFAKWDVLPQDQSLDGLAADWSAELSSVLKAPKVLFLQLYTDSPHRKLSRAFRHPVSGCIATCGHMPQATGAKMLQRARDYLVHMGDLEEKLVGQMSMRLEQVCKYRAGVEGVTASLEPQRLFGMKELRCLLRTRPLVVPFKDTADGSGVMRVRVR
ncbi:unnamed protein product [Boreogadus saida]